MIFVKDKIEVVKINKSGLKKEMKLDLFLTVFIHLLLLNIGTLRSSARRKLDDAAFKILKSNVNLKCLFGLWEHYIFVIFGLFCEKL